MVTENSHRSVRSIVGQHFGIDIIIAFGEFCQLILQCHGGVVRSENFGGKTFHQLRQVFVQ